MSGTPSKLAFHIACALAEEFFGFPDPDGRMEVPLESAALVAAGRIDLWRDWTKQPTETRRLVGRFLRVRPNEIGSHRRFRDMARTLRSDPDSSYELPADVPDSEVRTVVARHGQRPLDLAARLVEEAEKKYMEGRRPLPVAGPGRWGFGWRGESVVELPVTVKDAVIDPIVLNTTPTVEDVTVTRDELEGLIEEISRSLGKPSWRLGILAKLFDGLRGDEDVPVRKLLLKAGGIRLLNAPTGVGKSVLIRLLAIHLARAGVPVGIVAGRVDEAAKTTEEINEDLEALGIALRCATLVSPRRLAEKAAQAADDGQWNRFDTFGYGCSIAASVVDGPQPVPKDEPCTVLRPLVESGGHRRRPAPRHACPHLGVCDRHRGLRAAAAADIVVTNHHNLMHGTIPVPVLIDGIGLNRVSVQEFLLRRCAVLLIDEVDHLQSGMFDAGARQLMLAASGTAVELPLVQLDAERSRLLPAEDRDVVPPLTRTRFLADQFLNYVLEGDMWLKDARPEANGKRRLSDEGADSGWHLPGSRDALVLKHLFGIDDVRAEPALETVYERFNAIFPDSRGAQAPQLPEWLRGIADQLTLAVSNDSAQDDIREIRHRLHDLVAEQVEHEDDRREVVNVLLVRTWLGALHQALTRLTYAVAAPGAEMPAARVLAEQLGTVAQHQAIPYGPLGYLLFGFRVDRIDDPRPGGKLSVQAIGGDPHTTIAQLGGTVALAAAGVERVVLGLSATVYFPGAAREHVRAGITYSMTDADRGAFTTLAGEARDERSQTTIRIGGLSESGKTPAIRDLGARLWDQHLDAHLCDLAANDKDRELCMLVGNSYRHAALLAVGIVSRCADPGWVAVVVPRSGPPPSIVLPEKVVTLTIDELESLPRKHKNVKVCIAPLSLVARGLNILVPDDQRSALASVWVCVRPPTGITESAELFASVNAYALGSDESSVDPVGMWTTQRTRAFRRLFHILTSDPRFSRLSRELKAEAVAGMLVDMIQLAGRARRGGTSVELYLVDGAFHDPKHGTDIPGLLRYYIANLSPSQRRGLERVYGTTLTSWLDFAGIDKET